jgi:protein-S-isoprenylcysteine O-methyltransferase Ste14
MCDIFCSMLDCKKEPLEMLGAPGSDPRTARAAWTGLFWLQLVTALLIFAPAGTLRYWQGWVYLGLCFLSFGGMTLYLIRNDPELLARRMKGGSGAEIRPVQKLIQAISAVTVALLLIVSALDHSRHWSAVPLGAVLVGDLAVILGCYVIYRVFRENRYTAATIRVEPGQRLTDTGPYAVVRHPMYSGALLLLFGTPMALGSVWGLVISLMLLAAIVARLIDEEHLLSRELPGYSDYQGRVRSRLIPGIW